jgi:hypothetical protein
VGLRDHLTNHFKWTIRPESAEDIWEIRWWCRARPSGFNYRLRFLAANAIAAVLIMTAAGCAANRSAEQSQLAAARANAAADRAEASARAAEKAAHDATVATDRVEKVVREDSKAQRRPRHHRKLRHRRHVPAPAAAPPASTKPAEPTFIPPAD